METQLATQSFSGIKRIGAGWLKQDMMTDLSPFSVKVANVLGQAFDGIYHLVDGSPRALKDLARPTSKYERKAVFYGTLAPETRTFELLRLCCKAAGLQFTIKGHSKDALALHFSEGITDQLELHEIKAQVFQHVWDIDYTRID